MSMKARRNVHKILGMHWIRKILESFQVLQLQLYHLNEMK